MVSCKQSVLVALMLACASGALAGDSVKNSSASIPATAGKPKFAADDPIWAEPKPRAVRDPKVVKIDDLYDLLQQSFVSPHRVKVAKRAPVTAQNVNTVGEVPDSEWYTNRHARRRMSIDELVRGPGNQTPPDPGGEWRIISAKSDGVTPGFRIEDRHGNKYVLKFDPPDFPELASGADVIGSKMYYALGYNTPENYVVNFRRDQLVLTETSSWHDLMGKKQVLDAKRIDKWLEGQPRDAQGRYRGLASRLVGGKLVGPFTLEGTRSDDPNDIVPHENRRELRGMRLFAAWLNDTDTKSINTLDSVVVEDGVPFIKHYRIDWGASLGSDSITAKNVRRGHDYLVDTKSAAAQAFSFGFYLPKWMRTTYPSIRGVGTFDAESFDPVNWRPNYPVVPFMLMDDEDAFWAAKKVMAFSNDDLRAIVETAHYTDPRATEWVTNTLIQRREKIAQAWLTRGLALDNFRVEDGRLAFDDLAVTHNVGAPRTYAVQWVAFDNANATQTPIDSRGRTIPTSGATAGSFLAARITVSEDRAAQPAAVTVYLRPSGNDWSVAGIDRRY